MENEKCVYCTLPEIKERTIIDNKLAWCFPTNIPIVPGHVLICPKRCVEKLEDLTQEELKAILELRLKLKQALIEVFGAEGFNYAWNEGKIAGQAVPICTFICCQEKRVILELQNMTHGSFSTDQDREKKPQKKS